MQELLAKVVELVTTYPAAVAGIGVTVLLAAFVWGVVSTSYRYR